MTDVTTNSRLSAVTSTTCSTLLLAVCVFKTVFFTHRHPAHPVSVPIRHPREISYVVTSFETDVYIYTSQVLQDTRYIRGILMHVASGLFSCGAWRRGSWYFQVLNFHLQSVMGLCPLT